MPIRIKTTRNKYPVSRAEERRWRNKTYDSKGEMRYALHLDMLKQAGEIIDYCEQPQVILGSDPPTRYKPDFLVFEPTDYYFVDYKGHIPRDFGRIMKLWDIYMQVPLHLVTLSGDRFETIKIIG